MPSGVRVADVPRFLFTGASFVLVLHGLIHLLGTVVYLRIADIQGFTYKTTLLGGRLDLGTGGTRVFGALWLLAAMAFVFAAMAMLQGWDGWRGVLVSATILSLGLTGLDSSVAFAGAIVDIIILVVLWLGPRAVSQLS